jgi:hypothetical protein
MATKKQQRRREKLRRHDGVWIDPTTGEELTPEEAKARLEVAKEERPAAAKPAAQQQRGGRRGREMQPPSWRRLARRWALILPVFIVFVVLTTPDKSAVWGSVAVALPLLALFIPLSYLIEKKLYESHLRRTGQAPKKK